MQSNFGRRLNRGGVNPAVLICVVGISMIFATVFVGTYNHYRLTRLANQGQRSNSTQITTPQFPRTVAQIFPHQFPPIRTKLPQDQFQRGAPHRVLEIQLLNPEGTIGVACVELPGGNTFLTTNQDVIKLGPGTYFRFLDEESGRRSDKLVVVEESEVAFWAGHYDHDDVGP